MTLPKNSVQNIGIVVVFLVSLLLLTPQLQNRVHQLKTTQLESGEGGIKWNSLLVKLMAFGHSPVLVDISMIRMHLEDRITHVKEGEFAKTYYDLNLATDLDPRFKELYYHGANFLTVVRGDYEGALRIINKGTRFIENDLMKYPKSFQDRYWSDPWRIYLVEGYIYLFHFQNLDAAGVSYGKMATYPDTPPTLHKLGESLKEPKGIYRVGHQALTQMIASTSSPEEKEKLRQKVQSLLVNYFIFQANELHSAKMPYPATDPLGGKLFLTADGKVDTTTPYETMFGKLVAVPEKGR